MVSKRKTIDPYLLEFITSVEPNNIKSKAVFFDRDGTIIEDRGYIKTHGEVVFFPFTFDALKKLQSYFLLFIVTNQSGIAKKLTTKADVETVNKYMIEIIRKNGIHIQELYYCPHNREDNCECIKPKPYFIKKAVEKYNIDISKSFVVGDHPHDVEFAENAGAKGIYLLTGHGQKHISEIKPGWSVANDLSQAVDRIIAGD